MVSATMPLCDVVSVFDVTIAEKTRFRISFRRATCPSEGRFFSTAQRKFAYSIRRGSIGDASKEDGPVS